MTSEDSYPRRRARTQRFTLGTPRQPVLSPGGERVTFVRTASGTSRTGSLWQLAVGTGEERLLADPELLLGQDGEVLSREERARRERSREAGAGVVGYSTDAQARVAAFALGGKVWVVGLGDGDGEARALPTVGGVIDPRVDPTGTNVAYASDGALRVIGVDGDLERVLAAPDGPHVVWGQAEFVAAEEMERYRGFWWSPDGEQLLVERYDESPVGTWYVADPADPAAEPVAHRYPAAGTDDAVVGLWVVGLDGSRVEVAWDWMGFPYLTRVSWSDHGRPVVQVMSRDQRTALVLAVDPATGECETLREQHDDVWVDLVPGVPCLGPEGRLVTVEDDGDVKRVHVDGVPVGPADLQVRSVLDVDETGVLVGGSTEPTEVHVVHVGWDGSSTRWSDGPGVHGAVRSGASAVVTRTTPDSTRTQVVVLRDGAQVAELASRQEDAGPAPRVEVLHAGEHALRTAVLFPRDHERGSARLPVVMDPYGGPHAQKVLASGRGALLDAQWLADQGFCVVVADGRGTPGRGRTWERAVRDDLAAVTLQDQVDALAAVVERFPDDVDTARVGIRGWSYGGFLSALAVLRRPDVFHAAVAGAPVTDWRLYDTFYTERYLGHPGEQPDVYARNSLLTDAAGDGEHRPLMIVHGMVDDNVVVAHSLRLSSALLSAGRPHGVLPLTGVTHMASQEEVAENLELLQVDFLRRSLSGA